MNDTHTWTSAEIEAKRREIADQLGDVRVDLRYLVHCRQELRDHERTSVLNRALWALDEACICLGNARRNVEQVAS